MWKRLLDIFQYFPIPQADPLPFNDLHPLEFSRQVPGGTYDRPCWVLGRKASWNKAGGRSMIQEAKVLFEYHLCSDWCVTTSNYFIVDLSFPICKMDAIISMAILNVKVIFKTWSTVCIQRMLLWLWPRLAKLSGTTGNSSKMHRCQSSPIFWFYQRAAETSLWKAWILSWFLHQRPAVFQLFQHKALYLSQGT